MEISNKIHTDTNIYLCFIFWFLFFPLSHFAHFLDESILGSTVNLYGIITITLVAANSLWYLNRNLVLHNTEILRNMAVATGFLAIPLILHATEISKSVPMILPFVIVATVVFSLHQIRYSIEKRNLLLWIILAGNTINAMLHDASLVMQYNIETPPADGILTSISIIICMYLLLRSNFSVFNIIGNLFTLIILYLYLLHHINIKVILIIVPSATILLGLLLKEDLKTGLSIIAVGSACTWVAYCLGFFEDFDPVSELSNYITNTMAHINTAWNNFLLGHGLGTFAMANLEVNPNYYTERAYSTVLHLIATGGITALVPLLLYCYAMVKSCLDRKNSLSKQLSNLCLMLPFILSAITTSISVFSTPVFLAMCYAIWYVSCQNSIKKRTVKWNQIYIRRLPIAIITVISLAFFITGIISINQFAKIEKNGDCENLQRIINPIIVGDYLIQHEMKCVYDGLTVIPVAKWLASYRKIMTEEIIPYHPKKVFFEHLINLEEHYTEAEKKEIRDLADKLYPTLLMEIDENKKADSESKTDDNQKADSKPKTDDNQKADSGNEIKS